MRFDSQAPSGDEPSADSPVADASPPDPAERKRRRTNRAWSSPGTGPAPERERERFDKPLTETAWGWQRAGATAPEPEAGAPAPDAEARRRDPLPPTSRRTAVIPPMDPPSPPLGSSGPVPALLAEVRGELAQLRQAFAEAKAAGADPSQVTGAELAATIEALGTTLGTGMASLLSDHRSLLARDVEAAADRILEELGQRLRTSGAQTVDAVEERVRHVSAKSVTDLSEQLELRLDQIQAEVTGLRAVMLEIPDQTVVTTRLDQLAETITAARGRDSNRVSPAFTAAIEKTLAGPIEQLEAAIAGVGDAVRELIEERLPEVDLPDAAALEALTAEMTALRRRITLRTDGSSASIAPDTAADDDWDEPEPIPVAKPAAARKSAPRKATPARATKKATPAKKATKRRS